MYAASPLTTRSRDTRRPTVLAKRSRFRVRHDACLRTPHVRCATHRIGGHGRHLNCFIVVRKPTKSGSTAYFRCRYRSKAVRPPQLGLHTDRKQLDRLNSVCIPIGSSSTASTRSAYRSKAVRPPHFGPRYRQRRVSPPHFGPRYRQRRVSPPHFGSPDRQEGSQVLDFWLAASRGGHSNLPISISDTPSEAAS
jgi:hypothetical protein